jgi:glucose-6-phosphate 1-epimerase
MVTLQHYENGFEYLDISNDVASAKIALQGAHIFHYARHNETPILWLSEVSDFEIGKAIRGGVPLCWPWFGMSENADLPQHGFARTSMFTLVSSEEVDSKTTEVTLKLEDSPRSHKLWPYRFELLLHVRISDTLVMELSTKNLDDKPFQITQALHSYFQISDITTVRIRGLAEHLYFNALNQRHCRQDGDVTFKQEVDRIYLGVNDPILLIDENRQIKITNQNSTSVVVWNPWIDKCARMSAMNDDAYLTMLCIESANALNDARTIVPDASHILKATIY